MATVELDIPNRATMNADKSSESQSLWYKDAIIYQLHVRAFRDSNGDGIGDLRGLVERLDYIQDLGVTAIWMLPCFPSPLKDDGYDIADYTSINPQYGTLDDFRVLLDEAHRRDLRMITELVMNHTSDQHSWFQRSRRAAPNSRFRDWYVWSGTPDKYREARIIFQDFESSNWSWDPVAGAYFWHRFYSHQPDLNFDNPDVREAMFGALDFWLEMGVDGLRLDAVPYLFEREGTNCENLPETHAFLREVRAHIDNKFSDRMLLAEANQWPEDAAAYFGAGDECHMNFHFPLMPRLFMSVEREDRFPIIDVLDQTPQLPANCQWAIFLRNHDELTLEMVTDEERDYMYRTYALDSKARINLGIRRRLAPLMGNNRRKIELMNALLLSLPGTPIIYYGDEIGMGDNYYLGDRNGVRTPMQWSADRNAGFSRSNPQGLYLPIIIDPEYHYELCNVDAEHANPHSLLWWTRRILDLRKRHHAFGQGSFEPVSANNSKVFAFLRQTDKETLIIVANLSRFSQPAELDLSRFRGRVPEEAFGQTSFPVIDDRPYRLTLGPHGFLWFCIGCLEGENVETLAAELPTHRGTGSFDDLVKGKGRKSLTRALEPYLLRHRWFAGKARVVQSIDVLDAFAVEPPSLALEYRCILVRVNYAAGEPETYVIPLMLLDDKSAQEILLNHPNAGLMRLTVPGGEDDLVVCEATWSGDFWRQLLTLIGERGTITGVRGSLVGVPTGTVDTLWHSDVLAASPQVHGGQQTNTSVSFADRLIMKMFRRITPGENPEVEIGRQLTEHAALAHIPQMAGGIEYHDEAGRNYSIAIAHQFIPSVANAWTYTLDELGRYFETVQSRNYEQCLNEGDLVGATFAAALIANEVAAPKADNCQPDIPRSASDLMQLEPSLRAQETVGAYLHSAELMGRRLGELHVALAGFKDDPAFAPEPFSRLYQRSLYQSIRTQVRTTMDLLRSEFGKLGETAQSQANEVLQKERVILDRLGDLLHGRIHAQRIRCHGDFDLGQLLYTGKDFVIIDFEGDPDRPVSERRFKTSPLRDVAGMIRSFHHAAHAAMRGQAATLLVDHGATSNYRWAMFWYGWTSASFLRAYLTQAHSAEFLPSDETQLTTLLTAYLLDKALYELRYELNNRPDWVNFPLEGILQLVH